MRLSERYYSDIPIEFEVGEVTSFKNNYLNDFSQGGLSFHSNQELTSETLLFIEIPLVHSAFKVKSEVIWCKKSGDGFDVGVKFTEINQKLQTDMIEQICCIEHYKKEVFKKEGRVLSGEEAAFEWIKKYAKDYRNLKKSSMRGSKRHSSDIPIEYDIIETSVHRKSFMNNISKGGLSFKALDLLEKNALILVQIPLINPVFKITAKVISCFFKNHKYNIGVEFLDKDQKFKDIIVDQICYVENFKKEVLVKEGRVLSGEQAFHELLKTHTKDFPGKNFVSS